jgi:L-threonylcarbamoyladenylate synthase
MRIEATVFEPQQLQKAAAILERGGLAVYPTETFYALGADSANPQALRRLLTLKGRSQSHTLPLIAAAREQILPLLEVKALPALYEEIAAAFWPGPLTLILPARPTLPAPLLSPPLLAGGCPGMAVRLSSHPIASGLAAFLGRPVVSSSANLTGQAASYDPETIGQNLLRAVDVFLAGGLCPGGPASTVIDLRLGPPFKIIRQGAINLPAHWARPQPGA